MLQNNAHDSNQAGWLKYSAGGLRYIGYSYGGEELSNDANTPSSELIHPRLKRR